MVKLKNLYIKINNVHLINLDKEGFFIPRKNRLLSNNNDIIHQYMYFNEFEQKMNFFGPTSPNREDLKEIFIKNNSWCFLNGKKICDLGNLHKFTDMYELKNDEDLNDYLDNYLK